MNKKVKTVLVLALYMAVTVGIYYGVCYAMDLPFTELHLWCFDWLCGLSASVCGGQEVSLEVSSYYGA